MVEGAEEAAAVVVAVVVVAATRAPKAALQFWCTPPPRTPRPSCAARASLYLGVQPPVLQEIVRRVQPGAEPVVGGTGDRGVTCGRVWWQAALSSSTVSGIIGIAAAGAAGGSVSAPSAPAAPVAPAPPPAPAPAPPPPASLDALKLAGSGVAGSQGRVAGSGGAAGSGL